MNLYDENQNLHGFRFKINKQNSIERGTVETLFLSHTTWQIFVERFRFCVVGHFNFRMNCHLF